MEEIQFPVYDPALESVRAIDPTLAAELQARMRGITLRMARIPRRVREKIRTRRDWEPVWIVTPSAEAYQSSLRALENAQPRLHNNRRQPLGRY